MFEEEKSLLSKLWSNKGIDWTIMIVMAIALLCGALFSGMAGGLLSWCVGEADLSPVWKALAGLLGYGSALVLSIWVGRKIDARKRRANAIPSRKAMHQFDPDR